MTENEADIDWYSKYRELKSKVKELKEIRKDSVKTDAEDLKKKMEEHKKVHNLSMHELQQQNDDLKRSINKIASDKEEIRRLKESNNKIRQNLKNYDQILNEFLDFKDVSIECIGKHKYQLSLEITFQKKRETLKFVLERSSNAFLYRSIYCPDSLKEISEYLDKTVEIEDIRDFSRYLNGLLDK
ncbi:hypothetical protein M9Y10_029354 [Tritrichomonas musculus]|uniref:Kinetochore protein SPC25 n=1 Tax=Tritrichomonas musculus TaxID=1915356 RepID=A0ABR2KN14_9EUKA